MTKQETLEKLVDFLYMTELSKFKKNWRSKNYDLYVIRGNNNIKISLELELNGGINVFIYKNEQYLNGYYTKDFSIIQNNKLKMLLLNISAHFKNCREEQTEALINSL